MPTNEVFELKRSVTGDPFILLAQNNSYWPGPRSLLNGRRRRKSGDVGHRLRAAAAANRPPPPGRAERRGSPPARGSPPTRGSPPAGGRQRPGKGPHVLHALKLPPKPESRVGARHVRTKTQPPRTENGPSAAAGVFLSRWKVRSEAKIRSCARLPSCRSDDEIQATSSGRRQPRWGVASPPSCVL